MRSHTKGLWSGVGAWLVLCLVGCHGSDHPPLSGSDAGGSDAGGSMDGSKAELDAAGSGTEDGSRMDVVSPVDAGDQTPDGAGSSSDAGQPSGTCYGACLEAVFAQCPKVGQSCTSAVAGSQTTSCYANGVKSRQTQTGSTVMATVTKANGDVCYEIASPSTSSETITSPNGAVIATIDLMSATHLFVTCQDGTTTDVDLTSAACVAEKAPTCTSGTCAWP